MKTLAAICLAIILFGITAINHTLARMYLEREAADASTPAYFVGEVYNALLVDHALGHEEIYVLFGPGTIFMEDCRSAAKRVGLWTVHNRFQSLLFVKFWDGDGEKIYRTQGPWRHDPDTGAIILFPGESMTARAVKRESGGCVWEVSQP